MPQTLRCIGILFGLWLPFRLAAQSGVTLGFKAGGSTVVAAEAPAAPAGGQAGVFVGYRAPACRLGLQVEFRYRSLPRESLQPELLTLAQIPVDPEGRVSVYAGPAFKMRGIHESQMQQIRPELVSGIELRVPLSNAWTLLADSRMQTSQAPGELHRMPRRQLTLHLSVGIGLRMLSIRQRRKPAALQPQASAKGNMYMGN